MNKLLDFIGNRIQLLGFLALGALLVTAGTMYFGVPGFLRRDTPYSAPRHEAGCMRHAAAPPSVANHATQCGHAADDGASGGCCSSKLSMTSAALSTNAPACHAPAAAEAKGEVHAH